MDFEKDQRFRYIFHYGKQLYPERCFESFHLELVKNFFFFFWKCKCAVNIEREFGSAESNSCPFPGQDLQ